MASLEATETSPATVAASNTNGQNGGKQVEVICVGLMRTGLQSLHKAFEILGYTDIYDQDSIVTSYELWNNVIENRAPEEAFSSMFQGSQIVMGMPTFCFWEDIFKLYPNARVILTERAEDGWWSSVEKAKIAMDRDIPGAPLRYSTILRAAERFMVPSYNKFCQVLRFSWAITLGATALHGAGLNESTTRGAFKRHNAYVQGFFKDRKLKDGSPQLLVFDVRQGWEPLCKFLTKDVPKEEFPSKEHLKDWPEGQPRPDWYDKVTGFDELFSPDSDFGSQLRNELRRGLIICAIALTKLLTVGFCLAWFFSHKLSFILSIIYLSLMIAGWSAYGVMHQLVVRVPLLMVLPLALKSLMIAGALHACFISYGIFKEVLVTKDGIASSVLVLSSRLMSIICACIYMLMTEGRISLGAPILSMSAFAFTNEASTWAGYEMLKYVSFPLQVMAKSVKMLPNMIMARVVNGTRHSTFQYIQAIVALICVGIMHFSGEQEQSKKGKKHGGSAEMDPNYKLMMGVIMLMIFFVCDAFTSNWQQKLYTKYPKMTQTQMMLAGNLLGFIFTSGTVFASWSKIMASLTLAMNDTAILWRIIGLGVVSALGQFCIYSAIRILGPLAFTWIMTARQLLSVLISLIFFGHGVSIVKILCIMTVFSIMSAKQLAKVGDKLIKKEPVQKLLHSCRKVSVGNAQAPTPKKND